MAAADSGLVHIEAGKDGVRQAAHGCNLPGKVTRQKAECHAGDPVRLELAEAIDAVAGRADNGEETATTFGFFAKGPACWALT